MAKKRTTRSAPAEPVQSQVDASADELDEAGIIESPEPETPVSAPEEPDDQHPADDQPPDTYAGLPPITGLGDGPPDEDEEEPAAEPQESEDTETEPADEELPAEGEPDEGAGDEPDPVELANYWYQRTQEARAELDRLRRSAVTGPTASAPAAPQGQPGPVGAPPGPPTAPHAPSVAPAPPTAEQIAAEMGSYPDDPAVVAEVATRRRIWELERIVQAQAASLEPLRQTYHEQQFERKLIDDFTTFVNDPTQVPPDKVQEVWNLYGYLRPLMGRRAASWADALVLFHHEHARRAAPAAAREAGRREGFAAAVQRSRQARAQNLTAASPPRRMTTAPRPMSFDESFNNAKAKIGRS